jgi:hypothetical protein
VKTCQLLRAGAVLRRLGDADTGGDRELLAVQAEGVGEDLQDAVGQPRWPGRVVIDRAHHQEFVAAETRDQPLGAHRALDAPCRRGQQPVAGCVAEHIVDDLEPVQVDVQHGQCRLGRIGEAGFDLEAQRIAVEQPGQRVRARLYPQGFLAPLAVGDVLQGAGQAGAQQAADPDLADCTDPEWLAVTPHSLQFELQVAAGAHGLLKCLAQAAAVGFDQAVEQAFDGVGCLVAADDPAGLVGQIKVVASGVPLPAADPGQRLGAREQGAVALECGDVRKHRQHLLRPLVAGQELRHRGDRYPGEAAALAVEEAQHGAVHGAPIACNAGGRQLVGLQLASVFVDHQPVLVGKGPVRTLPRPDAEQATGSQVRMGDPALRIAHQDRLVDVFHQRAIAQFGVTPAAEVAGHRNDAVAAVEPEVGRMHLDREPAAVGPHVVDLQHIGVAAVEGFPDRLQVVGGQVRIDQVDGLADDVLAGALVGPQPGLVEIEHDAVGVQDADRIGHRIEQCVVVHPRVFRVDVCGLQGARRADQQRADGFIERQVVTGRLQRRRRGRRIRSIRRRGQSTCGRRGFHAGVSALATLLPVSRPSRADSQRPVSASRSRSMPVRMPSPCSM